MCVVSGASSKRAPIPADGEFLSDAAERTGYKPEQLARILAWHGAEVRRCWYGRRARPWALRADVDAAVAAWLDTETVQSAALRRDVPPSTLRDWLARAGLERPARHQHWRLPSATIDAVVAERRLLMRREDEGDREILFALRDRLRGGAR